MRLVAAAAVVTLTALNYVGVHKSLVATRVLVAATLATLTELACWLGCLIALFIAGLHYSILVANASVPPRLPDALFWTLLTGFCAGLALWTGALYLRFRNAG